MFVNFVYTHISRSSYENYIIDHLIIQLDIFGQNFNLGEKSTSKVQGLFIHHILNYTGYNQKWNVNQIRSAQWTVPKKKNVNKGNTTQEHIYKYRLKKEEK